jgi:hypothetical protein
LQKFQSLGPASVPSPRSATIPGTLCPQQPESRPKSRDCFSQEQDWEEATLWGILPSSLRDWAGLLCSCQHSSCYCVWEAPRTDPARVN